MKICKKCKTEYKDAYLFCPKCGTPYDEKMKKAKIPLNKIYTYKNIITIVLYVVGCLIVFTSIMHIAKSSLEIAIAFLFSLSLFNVISKIVENSLNIIDETNLKIIYIIFYVFGCLITFFYIMKLTQNIFNSFVILIILGLFNMAYILIENKFNAKDEKYFKIIRIVLPIFLLIIWINYFPKTENESSNIQKNNTTVNEVKSESNDQKKEDVQKETETTIISYELNYNLPGNYGRLVEYEGEYEYFYYFPSGTYEIEATMVSNLCFLWIDYNVGYNNSPYGTAYNNKQKLQFSKVGEKKIINLTDDVHIYNSNNCNYKLIKK